LYPEVTLLAFDTRVLNCKLDLLDLETMTSRHVDM